MHIQHIVIIVSLDMKYMISNISGEIRNSVRMARLACFWSSLIVLISKDTNMGFTLSCIFRRWLEERLTNESKTAVCLNLQLCCKYVRSYKQTNVVGIANFSN